MVEGVKGIIFLGPPGAGKGTQAKKMANFLNYSFISTGDILREEVLKQTELGKLAKNYMEKGRLVPDEIMLKIIEKNLQDSKTGFILDGFPRTLPQAEGLDDILKKNNLSIEKVFYLNASEEEIVKRLSSRRVCPECKKVYNLITDPPEKDEECDVCNVRLIKRADDEEDVIKTRLEVYKKDTEPLLKYYREKIVEIEGDASPEDVFDKIKSFFKAR